MTMRLPKLITVLWLSAAAAPAAAQKLPTVHFIDRPVATSKHEFRSLAGIRHLPNGNLLLNDASRHQLLLLDSSLTPIGIVADSESGSSNAYGTSAGLLSFAGDSSLLVLPRVPSMYMIDPAGKIVRVMSVPRAQDAPSMASTFSGIPGFDAKGRWVYRGSTPPLGREMPSPGGPPVPLIGPDSAPIVRVDPVTRVFDTVAMVKILSLRGKTYWREGGMTMTMLESNPLPRLDDWAVLADGSVAIVRGQDYHIDFINRDGTKTRGPKMAYAWEALNDDAKIAIMDSVKKAVEARRNAPSQPINLAGGSATGGSSGGSATGRGSSGGGATGSAVPASGDTPPPEFTSPSDLPDYRPPFTFTASRPDADGNLWIRTTHVEKTAGTVYDVVSREGIVVDRVQLQPGRSILGFGRAGIVYMAARDDSGAWIEKSRWKAP